MNLEQLNFDEEPLSREDLMRIKGGATAMYTAYGTNCSDTGDPNTADCSDGGKD